MKHSAPSGKHSIFGHVLFLSLIIPALTSCGGGGGGGGGNTAVVDDNDDDGTWTPGVFLPASAYRSRCAVTDENNFLRSYSNDTYLWYDEIVDRDPALYSTPVYFDLLKTDALTSSGDPRDKFHFSIPTDEWQSQSQAGVSIGYGAQFAILQSQPPRLVMVAYTEPGTPAVGAGPGLMRGAQILTVDGINVANGSDIDGLDAGLFPATAGESHTFMVRDPGGAVRSFTMQSAVIASTPVRTSPSIAIPGGKAGYLLFNDHVATAEKGLYDAITQLAAEGITELVLDIRYNGGGFLDIASELAYMVAGTVPTAGRIFEATRFNDKHPLFNPVTGEPLMPVPFHDRSLGFDPALPAGTLLPALDLSRVYVLTGPATCSASESIMNSLRGVGVDVVQIGSTTCGKPYGFYPVDNCGMTYFTIQFQGINAKGFGDYSDGFSPTNTVSDAGALVPGCSVHDDFGAELGDPVEARFAAALHHMQTGTCPMASGFSVPSPLRLSPVTVNEEAVIPKSAWQQNRIMRN